MSTLVGYSIGNCTSLHFSLVYRSSLSACEPMEEPPGKIIHKLIYFGFLMTQPRTSPPSSRESYFCKYPSKSLLISSPNVPAKLIEYSHNTNSSIIYLTGMRGNTEAINDMRNASIGNYQRPITAVAAVGSNERCCLGALAICSRPLCSKLPANDVLAARKRLNKCVELLA